MNSWTILYVFDCWNSIRIESHNYNHIAKLLHVEHKIIFLGFKYLFILMPKVRLNCVYMLCEIRQPDRILTSRHLILCLLKNVDNSSNFEFINYCKISQFTAVWQPFLRDHSSYPLLSYITWFYHVSQGLRDKTNIHDCWFVENLFIYMSFFNLTNGSYAVKFTLHKSRMSSEFELCQS